MVSHSFQEQQTLLQNPIFDALYCDEEDFSSGFDDDFNEIRKKDSNFLSEHDLLWEDDEIVTLLCKEKKETRLGFDEIDSDGCLKTVRNEAIKWILKVNARYGFGALTGVLAVNYYDRFVTSVSFKKDKAWMSQLVAVACVSVAAKVEETHVPLLLDLQVEGSKYFFEAKTIQKMELLVLSTLGWKMNPVTPISYLDHVVRRFGLMIDLHGEFWGKCESLILETITDSRMVHYLPSVIAAATMVYVFREIEPCNALSFQDQLMGALRMSKEKIDGCLKLVIEIMGCHSSILCKKRRYDSVPSSPSGVFDANFSSDSSNDSWTDSSFAEPLFKRIRAQEQHMRLSSGVWRG